MSSQFNNNNNNNNNFPFANTNTGNIHGPDTVDMLTSASAAAPATTIFRPNQNTCQTARMVCFFWHDRRHCTNTRCKYAHYEEPGMQIASKPQRVPGLSRAVAGHNLARIEAMIQQRQQEQQQQREWQEQQMERARQEQEERIRREWERYEQRIRVWEQEEQERHESRVRQLISGMEGTRLVGRVSETTQKMSDVEQEKWRRAIRFWAEGGRTDIVSRGIYGGNW